MDRRVAKTTHALKAAMIDLLQTRRYAAITVQDILDRANVGRTTFYAHFPAKDDLLIACVDDLFTRLLREIEKKAHGGDPAACWMPSIPASEIFEHIHENRRIIQGLLRTDMGSQLMEQYRSLWNGRLTEQLRHQFGGEPEGISVPFAVLTDYTTHTMINLIKWWLTTENEYTPAQIGGFFRALVHPGVSGVLGCEIGG